MRTLSLLLLVFSLIPAAPGGSEEPPVLRAGQPLSHVQLRLDDGTTLSDADWPARPVLIDFWATWCSPCLQAFPKLAQLHSRYGHTLFIVSVGVDEAATRQKARAILKQHALTWSQSTAGGGMDNPLLRRFQGADQKSLPTFVLIGPDRVIRYSGRGGDAQVDLLAAVEKLMGEPTRNPHSQQ